MTPSDGPRIVVSRYHATWGQVADELGTAGWTRRRSTLRGRLSHQKGEGIKGKAREHWIMYRIYTTETL